MKNKAINALIEMGMSANIKGFYFIVDAMCLFEEDNNYVCGKTTALYEKIAKRNDSSYHKVERAMRHAFGSVLTNGNKDAVDKYLSRNNTTVGNQLSVFYLRLTQED